MYYDTTSNSLIHILSDNMILILMKKNKGHRELSHLDESSIITSSGRPKRQRIEKKYSK